MFGLEILKHVYTKPGTYEVTGIMFDAYRDDSIQDSPVEGIISYSKFTIRFNINENPDSKEFIYLDYNQTLQTSSFNNISSTRTTVHALSCNKVTWSCIVS